MARYDPETCDPATPDVAEYAVTYALSTYPELVFAGPVIPVVTNTTDGCHPGGISLTLGAEAVAAWAAQPGD
jgi:hypothetical protein